MMITAHYPLGAGTFVAPDCRFAVEDASPAHVQLGDTQVRVGTIVGLRGGPDGHSLDIDIELDPTYNVTVQAGDWFGLMFDLPTQPEGQEPT